MRLSDFDWKTNYASDEDDLVADFYLPALERSNRYDRAVGFFSSHALAIVSAGLDAFLLNGGNMRVIASPKNLSDEDLEAIVRGEELRPLWDTLADSLTDDVSPEELDRLSLLSWMVASGRLDVRIALRVHPDGRVGLYHKKVGVFAVVEGEDDDPIEWMTFTGSPNETAGGILVNAEAFPLHLSWVEGQRPFTVEERRLFTSAWDQQRPEIWTWTANEWLADELRERFGSREPVPGAIYVSGRRQIARKLPEPSLPSDLELRPYQIEAVNAWIEAGGRGTFAMATGTGKTDTALAAATRVAAITSEVERPLMILVVVPLSDLVVQWARRARDFGFSPMTWSSATSSDEKSLIRQAFRRTSGDRTGRFVAMVITTADSLTAGLAATVKEHTGAVLVIGDEMHSLGTASRLAALPKQPTFTLGLSATPKRHFDDQGTAELLEYFGEPVLSISIKQAIEVYDALSRYRYHVHFVELTDDETAEYRRLSQRIAAAMGAGRDADAAIRERNNLVAHAEEKFGVLQTLMCDEPWMLAKDRFEIVYVGEGRPRGAVRPTISRVAEFLGNVLGMSIGTYTAGTPSSERQQLQADLASGAKQALVAMRCLDEGVDIPEARVGVILASTQNPRQFVQRRGRLLRKVVGKGLADVHDVLVMPQLNDDVLESDKTLIASELSRAYELADAAENRTDAMHVIRSRAIDAGLLEPEYPWMDDLLRPMAEWTTAQDGGAND